MVEVARYITVNMVDVLIACVVKDAVAEPQRNGMLFTLPMNPLSIIQHGGYVWRNYD